MSEKKTYDMPTGNPGSLRFGAVIFWILGLACEVAGILTLLEKIAFDNPIMFVCIFLVADLILVVIGSFMWKRANRIDPPSEKNKVEFFIKTQLGAIISTIAFFPILIFLLSDKNLDKKSKTWVSILAGVCLVAAVGLSTEWNPLSLEDLEQMKVNAQSSDFGAGVVQWSKNSKVYHTWTECSALHRILEHNLREGSVNEAFEAGKARMCRFCAGHFEITEGVEKGGPADQETLE